MVANANVRRIRSDATRGAECLAPSLLVQLRDRDRTALHGVNELAIADVHASVATVDQLADADRLIEDDVAGFQVGAFDLVAHGRPLLRIPRQVIVIDGFVDRPDELVVADALERGPTLLVECSDPSLGDVLQERIALAAVRGDVE